MTKEKFAELQALKVRVDDILGIRKENNGTWKMVHWLLSADDISLRLLDFGIPVADIRGSYCVSEERFQNDVEKFTSSLNIFYDQLKLYFVDDEIDAY